MTASRSICADLGGCAYDVATDSPHAGCPHWADCFGTVQAPPQPVLPDDVVAQIGGAR
jgi:hypothetical protein